MTRRLIALLMLLASARTVDAQTVTGRVTADADGAPLQNVSVLLLLDSDEIARSVATDGTGRYAITASSGNYKVVADLLGYERLESPLLALADGDTVTIDFELPVDPIEVEGIRVEVEQREALRRRVLQYGVRVDNVGARYVSREAIMRRETATNVGAILVWQNLAGVSVHYGDNPPSLCVQVVRGRVRCAITVLDGQIIDDEFAASMPPEVLEAVIILTPTEATMSFGTRGGGGAVLLFTRAGLAGGR